jgi:DNA-binding transcriptional ArsR family regulator
MKITAKMVAVVLALPENRNNPKATTQLHIPKYCSPHQTLQALYEDGYVNRDKEGNTYLYSLSSLGKELKKATLKYFFDKEFRDLFNLMDGVKEHTVLTLVSLGFDTLDKLEKYCLHAGLESTRRHLTRICKALHDKSLIEAYSLAGNRPIFLTDKGKEELSIVEDFVYSHCPSRPTTKVLSKKLPTKLLCGRE